MMDFWQGLANVAEQAAFDQLDERAPGMLPLVRALALVGGPIPPACLKAQEKRKRRMERNLRNERATWPTVITEIDRERGIITCEALSPEVRRRLLILGGRRSGKTLEHTKAIGKSLDPHLDWESWPWPAPRPSAKKNRKERRMARRAARNHG